MTSKLYTIKKIYLKTICCQTIFCLKSGDDYIKLIPVNTETGLLWIPKSNDIDLDYCLKQTIDNIIVQYQGKKKINYLDMTDDNIITIAKKTKKAKLFFINNLILDYNYMIKKTSV